MNINSSEEHSQLFSAGGRVSHGLLVSVSVGCWRFPWGFAKRQSFLFSVFSRTWRLSCLSVFQLHVREPKLPWKCQLQGETGDVNSPWVRLEGGCRNMTFQEFYIKMPICWSMKWPRWSFFFLFPSFPASFNCVCPFHCAVGCVFWMRRNLLLSRATGSKDGPTTSR